MSTLHPEKLTHEGFAPFGKVVLPPTREPTARGKAFQYWSDLASYHIEGETEIGLCTAHRLSDQRVDWMERHMRTPEILVPIDAPFLLPVMTSGADPETHLFRVDVGEAVVLDAGTWHSACLPAEDTATSYFVIFRRGTPHGDVEKMNTTLLRV